MKIVKSILGFLFGKIFIVTMVALMILLTELLFSSEYQKESSPRQLITAIMLIITPIMLSVFCHTQVDKGGWRLGNYIAAAFIFILGIALGNDYKNRPTQYSEFNVPYSISETKSNRVILEIDGYHMLSTYKSNLKYDSIHPLKVYSAYKVDVFGDKAPGRIALKSDLMNDYAYPAMSK